MPASRLLSATLMSALFAAAVDAQPQILKVAASTDFICEPYSSLETLTTAPASKAMTTVLPLSCGIERDGKASDNRFEAALIGGLPKSKDRAVITWNQLSFPRAIDDTGFNRWTVEMNDGDTFERREWFDGKLRISLKKDLMVAPLD